MELPDELIMYLYTFMDNTTLLKASSVCAMWKEIAMDGQVWRARAAISSGEKRLVTSQLDIEPENWIRLYRELDNVFVPTRMLNLLREAFEASSTDNQQELSNTLSKDELFWSSLGSDDKDSSEHVIYKLAQPLCVVKHIDIFAYKALYQQGMPIYPPQFIKVSVGFSPKIEHMHFTSDPFPILETDALQRLELPEPQFGGFVRLDLIGRQKTQPGDDLWYTVLRHVRVGGVPSGALMDKVYLTNSLLRFAFANEYFIKNFDNETESGEQDMFEVTKSKLKQGISASLHNERRKIEETANILKLTQEGKYSSAAKIAILSSPSLDLRTEEVLDLFKKDRNGLKSYFSVLMLSRADLNAAESLALAELSTQQGDFNLFDSFLRNEKIQPSEELGDFFVKSNNLNLAVYVYIRAHIPDKVNDTLIKLGQYAKIINYATITNRRLDFGSMLARFSQIHPKPLTYEFALALAIPHHNGNPLLSHTIISEVLKINSNDLIGHLTSNLTQANFTNLLADDSDDEMFADADEDEDNNENNDNTDNDNNNNNNNTHNNNDNGDNNDNNNDDDNDDNNTNETNDTINYNGI